MKRMFTLLGLVALLSFTVVAGIEEVVNGMKTGNAGQVAKYFDNAVEITLFDKSNSYSKSQAELVLKDFFATNPVKGFDVIHKGENGGSEYRIGNLATRTGTYRTTIFMKQKGDKQLLQEVRIENK
jgi:hypothetical protein